MSPDEITMRDLMDASLRAIDASVYALREQLVAMQQASSSEHAQVRADLGQMRSDIGEIRTQIAATPTTGDFRDFRQHMYQRVDELEREHAERIDALERDRDERAGVEKWKRRFYGAAGTILGLLIAAAALVLPQL